jgi:uncharacterized protein (TIGR03435 family)
MLRNPTVAFASAMALFDILFSAVDANGQVVKNAGAEPGFEVVSVKHAGNMMDGSKTEGGRTYVRPLRGPVFTGTKLSAVNNLGNIIAFAFAPLVKERKLDGWDWLYFECYSLDAIAPPGTTREGAQAMLRTALVDRFGLKYRLVENQTPVYALVRGSGKLQLTPAGSEPNTGAMKNGAFQRNSAFLADLAAFLSTLTDRQVLDRTGIQGNFKFNLDWSKEILDTMHEFGPHGDPTIVFSGVKNLGLKLEARKESIRTLAIDRVNREPTPN